MGVADNPKTAGKQQKNENRRPGCARRKGGAAGRNQDYGASSFGASSITNISGNSDQPHRREGAAGDTGSACRRISALYTSDKNHTVQMLRRRADEKRRDHALQRGGRWGQGTRGMRPLREDGGMDQ